MKKPFSLTRIFLILMTAFVAGCSDLKDDISDLKAEVAKMKTINNIQAFKNAVLEEKQSDNLITSIQNTDTEYRIKFEDATELQVAPGIVAAVEADSVSWIASFNFSDNTTIETFFLGKAPAVAAKDIKLSPHLNAPLSALVTYSVPVSSKIQIKVVGQDGAISDITHAFQNYDKDHNLEILGLYPDYTNTVEITCLNKNGNYRGSTSINITTDPLPSGFPEFEIVKAYDKPEKYALFLMDFSPSNYPFLVDQFGKIRWYSSGFSKTTKFGLQRLKNGNICFGKAGVGQGSVLEYTMLGEFVRDYNFYPLYEDAHHDVYETPNGNLLVPVSKTGAKTIEDYLIELDRNSGTITHTWNFSQILPKRATFIKDTVDWLHVNAVIYDERDSTIIISGQRQGVFKITWDNKLKWILSQPEGWEGYEDYLLRNSDPDFQWVWGQHAPMIMPNGDLFLFDNGFGRGYGQEPLYSRAVEFKISEAKIGGDVELVWEYGQSRGQDLFSPIISDVDYLPDTGTRLITAGALAFRADYYNNQRIVYGWAPQVEKSRIVEVTDNHEVVFEMLLKGKETTNLTYRSEKILSLYPE
jgi:arylsulfate sulfotransferase